MVWALAAARGIGPGGGCVAGRRVVGMASGQRAPRAAARVSKSLQRSEPRRLLRWRGDHAAARRPRLRDRCRRRHRGRTPGRPRVDHVQPLLVRVGRVMGARGLGLYRHVILPAALPSFVGGLKQGWAFAWRSLMAGELIIAFAGHKPSLGQQLRLAQNLSDTQQLIALMIVIFTIGVVVDLGFGVLDREIRQRWGLLGAES